MCYGAANSGQKSQSVIDKNGNELMEGEGVAGDDLPTAGVY